jgi:hypothetical protein
VEGPAHSEAKTAAAPGEMQKQFSIRLEKLTRGNTLMSHECRVARPAVWSHLEGGRNVAPVVEVPCERSLRSLVLLSSSWAEPRLCALARTPARHTETATRFTGVAYGAKLSAPLVGVRAKSAATVTTTATAHPACCFPWSPWVTWRETTTRRLGRSWRARPLPGARRRRRRAAAAWPAWPVPNWRW